jgi:hypothetical protein
MCCVAISSKFPPQSDEFVTHIVTPGRDGSDGADPTGPRAQRCGSQKHVGCYSKVAAPFLIHRSAWKAYSQKFRCRNLHRPHARTLSRTKNVRVSDGDRRRNQPHPNEDDKPPGRRFLRSSSHLSILPPNTLRYHGCYIRSSSLGPSPCPYAPKCVEGVSLLKKSTLSRK